MKRLGLTGGMGCGKTTVLKMFAEAGFATLETDRIARDLLSTDPEVIAALRGRWGGRIFDEAGKVDRHALAAIVFIDQAELAWLEGCLHPKVRERWLGTLAAAPQNHWAVEIPLLLEKNLEKYFDFVVCVSVERQAQQARLRARGLSEKDQRARLARQWPLSRKAAAADVVVDNSGSLAFTRSQVSRLLSA